MPPRGKSVDVPRWWLDALAAEVARRSMTHTDLAEIIAKRSRSTLAAARVKVTRFFDEADPTRTMEVVAAWSDALDLPVFEFHARPPR